MFEPSNGHSPITNERNLKMRNPRPVEGRAGNYIYQGSLCDGRLGPQIGGYSQLNFNTKPNPDPKP